MKIVSWNVNGIRSTLGKGLLESLKKIDADIVCLQETKADASQLPWDLLYIDSYEPFFSSAQKKGYSGTAIYTKTKPQSMENKSGMKRFDEEGRFLRINFEKFSLINLYIPNGGRQKEFMDYKLNLYSFLMDYLYKKRNENLILAGDFNVAHKEIDLARPKENVDNTMFTPVERLQIANLLDLGFIDTFRIFNQEGGWYSWWAYFRNLRERNIGWRIDYIFVSKSLKDFIKNAFILPEIPGSDHCPVGIEIDF